MCVCMYVVSVSKSSRSLSSVLTHRRWCYHSGKVEVCVLSVFIKRDLDGLESLKVGSAAGHTASPNLTLSQGRRAGLAGLGSPS